MRPARSAGRPFPWLRRNGPDTLRPGPLGTLPAPYFARYCLSTLIQFFAFAMQMIGLQWLITDLTPSRTALGMVGFVQG